MDEFEGRIVGGKRLVTRSDGAVDTVVCGDEMGICVLLVDDCDVEFERFNGGNGPCDVGDTVGCETSSGVAFIDASIGERLTGGIGV